MTRFNGPNRLGLVIVLLMLTLSLSVRAGTTTVVSDSSWWVLSPNPNLPGMPLFLGPSQAVCLNTTNPLNCPPGAILYGYPYPGWSANLSALPQNTKWIWANRTGFSTPAAGEEFIFQKGDIYVCDPPLDSTISIAADDRAEVSVNGNIIANSVSQSPNQLLTFAVPASVLKGSSLTQGVRANEISVRAKNGPNPQGCGDNYACNPAGVVVAATLNYSGDPPCIGYTGSFSNGGFEKLASCPAGQVGSIGRICACGNWLPRNTCESLPQCTGEGGRAFSVNEIESKSCPAGQTASPASHKCLSTGNWDVPLGQCFTPQPPARCTGEGGRLYDIDEVEARSCPAGQTASPASHKCLSSGSWDSPLGQCVAPPPTCTGSNGRAFAVGATEALSCTVGTGTPSRTCQPGGTWGPTIGKCTLRRGDRCGGRPDGYIQSCLPGTCIASCPVGTDCKSRRVGRGALVTTDWYCDP